MKRILGFMLSLFLFLGCDSEDAFDCFQTSGNIITKEYDVQNFNRIQVNRGVQLFIEDQAEYKVIIEAGNNLINDVNVNIEEEKLIINDENSCNLVRDIAPVKVYVSAPNITEIINSSQYEIQSLGVLNFEAIDLVSEDINTNAEFTIGDFRLQLNSSNVRVFSNNLSSFYLKGTVNELFIGFFSGAGRFEGQELIANNIEVFHRGSNDMLVFPLESLKGELRGIGDVISFNLPSDIDLEQFFSGRLILNN